MAARVAPKPGYFDVVVHGDASSFYVLHNGSWVAVKPNTVRQYITRQPGYRGQPIRLIACEAGAAANGIAQSIANGLGKPVLAPVETVWIHRDGQLRASAEATGPDVAWRELTPGKPTEAPAPAESATRAPGDAEPARVPGDEPRPVRPDEPSRAPSDDDLAPGLDPEVEGPARPADGPVQVGPKKTASTAPTGELPPRRSSGTFVDAELDAKYQAYRARKKNEKASPRSRLDWKQRVDWWMNDSPVARGNRFDRSVERRQSYPFNQVELIDGSRLDSYIHDGNPKRISRKATDFNKVSDSEFESYLDEIETKYPRGKLIKSRKYEEELGGKRLRGDPVLEVPADNLKPELASRRADLETIAARKGVEIRYTQE